MSDLILAEQAIVKYVQRATYEVEIKKLKQDVSVGKNSNLNKLNPMVKDGILSVGGGLHNVNLTYSACHKCIIPNKNHVATLIIQACYEQMGHLGIEAMLAEEKSIGL